MPARKKTTTLTNAVSAAIELAQGRGRRGVIKEHGISERDVGLLRKLAGASVEAFNEELSAQLRLTRAEVLARLRESVDQIPVGQLAVTFGILSDKQAQEAPQAPTVQHNSVTINGYTKEDLIEMLHGRKPVNNISPVKI